MVLLNKKKVREACQ